MSIKDYFKQMAGFFWKETQEDISRKANELKADVEAKIREARDELDRKLGNESAHPGDWEAKRSKQDLKE